MGYLKRMVPIIELTDQYPYLIEVMTRAELRDNANALSSLFKKNKVEGYFWATGMRTDEETAADFFKKVYGGGAEVSDEIMRRLDMLDEAFHVASAFAYADYAKDIADLVNILGVDEAAEFLEQEVDNVQDEVVDWLYQPLCGQMDDTV